jgi:hypothetical protein
MRRSGPAGLTLANVIVGYLNDSGGAISLNNSSPPRPFDNAPHAGQMAESADFHRLVYFAAASPFPQTHPARQAKRSPTVLLSQVLPDDLNHAVGSRTRWEKP